MLHEKAPGATFGNWVDVRDVAESHLIAMEREEVSGQRIICSAGERNTLQLSQRRNLTLSRPCFLATCLWVCPEFRTSLLRIDVFSDDTINNTAPPLRDIPRGQPGDVEKGNPLWTFKTDKIQKLGLQYRTLAESARDSVISMREHGW